MASSRFINVPYNTLIVKCKAKYLTAKIDIFILPCKKRVRKKCLEINQKYILMHNYQPKNFPPSSQVFSQSDLPHNVRLWCFSGSAEEPRKIGDLGCNSMIFDWISIKFCIFADGQRQLFPRHKRKRLVEKQTMHVN